MWQREFQASLADSASVLLLVIRALSVSVYECMCVSVCRFALFSFTLLVSSSQSLSTKSFMDLPPPLIQNQYVKQGMGGRYLVVEDATGVVLVVSPEMRISPSTCRVLTSV